MQTINITTSTILRTAVIILALVFIWAVWEILAVLFLALIIASVVEPIVAVFSRLKIPRFVSVSTLFLGLLLFFLLCFYFILPSLASEIKHFALSFPSYYQELASRFKEFQEISQHYKTSQILSGALESGAQELTGASSNLISFISALFGGLVFGILIFVLAFYLSLQKDGVKQVLKMFTPPENQEYVLRLWARAQRKMRGWLGGRLLSAFVVGGLVYIGLELLGVRYAISLGIIAAILEIIPFIGPILAGGLAIIIASLQSLILAFWVFVVFVIVERIDNLLITPTVMKKATGLDPVVIILALLMGAKLGGILGMLISIPLASIALEFLKDLRKD